MEYHKKFKCFTILLVYCLANFAAYSYFSDQALVPQAVYTLQRQGPLTDRTQISQGSPAKHVAYAVSISPPGNPVNVGKADPNANGDKLHAAEFVQPTPESSIHQDGDAKQDVSAAKDEGKQEVVVTPTVAKAAEEKGDAAALAELPLCPLVPPNLNGPLAPYKNAPSFEEIAKLNPGLGKGGLYKPPGCRSRHHVAIVIPYRNREEHLKVFLHNMIPVLQRQQLDYGIYVVDQALPGRFNRAMLMNVGYVEAMKVMPDLIYLLL